MRVKLTYSIPVEECLEKADEFFNKADALLGDVLTKFSKIKSESLVENAPYNTLGEVDKIRKDLYEIDSQLNNVVLLLRGHMADGSPEPHQHATSAPQQTAAQLEEMRRNLEGLKESADSFES
jgi:hypothetical protein